MKKKIMLAALAAVMTVSLFAGCTTPKPETPPVATEAPETPETPEPTEPTTPEEPQDEYETAGEIMAFTEDGVSILTGDIMQDFAIDAEQAKTFYLGETVGVKKMEDGTYALERLKGDPEARYTTEGQMIITVSGTVKSVDGGKFVVTTENGELSFDAGDAVELEKDAKVIIDYFEFEPNAEEKILYGYYDEASKMVLTVKNIGRTQDGKMMLGAEDEKGGKFEVYVAADAVVNFDRSELKTDDQISVYPSEIRESDPAQVDVKMILK